MNKAHYTTLKKVQTGFNSRGYWLPTRRQFYKKLQEIEKQQKISRKQALVLILDYLDEILKCSEKAITRLARKTGKDLRQVRVAVAGNN